MPITFKSIPVSQIPKPQKGRKPTIKLPSAIASARSSQTPQVKATKRTSIVTARAYGGKLFEPIMTKEKPIVVEFVPYFSSDNCRFSTDGFFAIKYVQTDRRCYLIYFINPIKVHREITLALACQEAIEFQTFEFEDDEEYRQASLQSDKENLHKLRKFSALGKVVEEVSRILQDRLIAEKFLLRQRLFLQQEKDWKDEFKKIVAAQEEEEMEVEDELEQGTSDAGELELLQRPEDEEEGKDEKGSGVFQKEGKEIPISGVSDTKTGETKFVWGGK